MKYLVSLVAFSVSFVATGKDFECDEDAAGCPLLTPELREALRKAIGLSEGSK